MNLTDVLIGQGCVVSVAPTSNLKEALYRLGPSYAAHSEQVLLYGHTNATRIAIVDFSSCLFN
jgi:uncharacterized protein (DUF1330 family)